MSNRASSAVPIWPHDGLRRPGPLGGKRLITYYDISELKDRESELAEALEKARLAEAVVDSVPNAMFVKDASLKFVLANKAFADTFGVEPSQ